jgi:hypothetical protein
MSRRSTFQVVMFKTQDGKVSKTVLDRPHLVAANAAARAAKACGWRVFVVRMEGGLPAVAR